MKTNTPTADVSESLENLMQKYLETLSEKEKRGYFIAKEHLGMSFQLEKSVGFLNWMKSVGL